MAAQQIDWPGIQAAAVALESVNGAAVQAAVNLPPDEAERLRERINKRGLRERWLDKAKAAVVLAADKSLSKSVQTGAEIAANSIAENQSRSRVALHSIVRKSLERTDKRKSGLKIADMQDLRHAAAIVEPKEVQASASLTLNILGNVAIGNVCH